MAANRSMTKLLNAFDTVNNKVTFDSDSTVTAASKGSNLGAGISTVTNVSDLPSVAQAYSKILVTGTNTLYQYSTGGWYPIAIINNFNPAFTTSPNATYALSLSGAATTVTVLATDSDDVPIKYITITDSSFDTFATITHDSDKHNVFTVIPIDSDGSNSGDKTGTVTFRASDGVNVSNANSTFTLTFGPNWAAADSDTHYDVYPSDVLAGEKFGEGDSAAVLMMSNEGTRMFVPAGSATVTGSNGANVGSLYILTTTDDWQTNTIEAELGVIQQSYGGSYNTYFAKNGMAVDESGTYLVVGAYRHGTNLIGRMYCYSRTGTTWNLDQTINGSTSAGQDYVGFNISMSKDGTVMAMTGYAASTNYPTKIYTRTGTQWTLRQTITNNAAKGTPSGQALTEDGRWLFLEEKNYTVGGAQAGRIAAWKRADGTNSWSIATYIYGHTFAPATIGAEFGKTITCNKDGTVLAVGAPDYNPGKQAPTYVGTRSQTANDMGYVGTIYIITRPDSDSTSFSAIQNLNDTQAYKFGATTSGYNLSGKNIMLNKEGDKLFVVAGQYYHRNNSTNYNRKGAWQIWEESGGTWSRVVHRIGADSIDDNADELLNSGDDAYKFGNGTMEYTQGKYAVATSGRATPPGSPAGNPGNTGYVTVFKG